MTLDVDIYDDNTNLIEVSELTKDRKIKMGILRMKEKDKRHGVLKHARPVPADISKRIDLIKRRNRYPIIYHQVRVNNSYSTIHVQLKGFNPQK